MVTSAQAAANVRSATRLIAANLGYYNGDGSGFEYGDLSASEQIALTNALADYIKANPSRFDTGTATAENPVVAAPLSRNQPLSDTSWTAGEFIDAAAENARAINPLDPQNIATVGKYVLGAAVVVAVAYLAINYLPAALKRANP